MSSRAGNLLAGAVMLLFVGSMFTIILTIAIWPGEAELVAPLFCPDDRSDAVVVRDVEQVRAGETSINYSLYCVGERGDVTEVGFLGPFVALMVIHTALLVPLVWLLGRGRARRQAAAEEEIRRQVARQRSEPEDPPWVPSSTSGPFVD